MKINVAYAAEHASIVFEKYGKHESAKTSSIYLIILQVPVLRFG
jgi:hypothetical protein